MHTWEPVTQKWFSHFHMCKPGWLDTHFERLVSTITVISSFYGSSTWKMGGTPNLFLLASSKHVQAEKKKKTLQQQRNIQSLRSVFLRLSTELDSLYWNVHHRTLVQVSFSLIWKAGTIYFLLLHLGVCKNHSLLATLRTSKILYSDTSTIIMGRERHHLKIKLGPVFLSPFEDWELTSNLHSVLLFSLFLSTWLLSLQIK